MLQNEPNSSGFSSEMDILNQAEAVFQFATEGMLITDNKGQIVKINPSAEQLFGYGPGELLGQEVEVLIPNTHQGLHRNHRTEFFAHASPRRMGKGRDLFGQRKDGSAFPIEISLSPFQNSQGSFVIAFIIDITVRKQAETHLREYNNRLEQEVEDRTLILKEAIQKLEHTKEELHHALQREMDLNRMKSNFISLASHEFRTPLATVLSSLSLVQKYADMQETTKRDKHITRIQSSVKHLNDILNDFLSVSKLEEGKVVCQPVWTSLSAVIQQVIPQMQEIARPGQTFDVTYSIRRPVSTDQVYIDPALVRNILFNLLSNAIKYSPPQSAITLRADINAQALRIAIRDQGIGIPPEDQGHLFERFFRASNAGNIAGTGLGLHIVGSYVRLMNGGVSFNSQVNEGTEFIVDIPQPVSVPNAVAEQIA